MKKFYFLLFAFAANLILASMAFGQITQRGTATSASGTTSLTITKPTGVVSGDVLIANISQSGNGADLSAATSSGWILIDDADLNGTTERWGTVLYKVAGGSEPANYTFTLDADGNSAIGTIIAFANVNTTGGFLVGGGAGGPFDVAPGTITVSSGSGNAPNAPAITTNTSNAAVIMLVQVGGSDATSGSSFGGWTIGGSISPFNEVADFGTTTGEGTSVGAAFGNKVAAGSTGAGGATITPQDRNGAILLALRFGTPVPTATLTPAIGQFILTGNSVNFTATANNYSGSGNYTFNWVTTGGTIPGANPVVQAGNSNSKNITFSTAGVYTVKVQITRDATVLNTNTVVVNVADIPSAPNLWATSTNGTIVSAYTVIHGTHVAGPVTVFDPTIGGTVTSTAALGRSDKPNPGQGYYYWLPNSGTNGVVNVYAAAFDGTSRTLIGTLDVNGASTNALGFVRLGMGPDGTGWILAGDGTTLYLAKFLPVGASLLSSLPAANQLTVVDASVQLVGGAVGTFQNGDVCVSGNGVIYALANDGGGVTQIFTGLANGASTTLTKKWDLVNASNNPFTGSVNGVAFDLFGSLYISTADGLYYINQSTVNGPAGTVQCTLVDAETGLQDLASNVFPTQSTLPVKLLSFGGAINNDITSLKWTVENEYNFDIYEIERSNGSGFVTIGSKAPLNSTSKVSYQYTDNLSAVNGNVFYYRLKMKDLDGKFSYSNQIMVRKESKTITLTVNPNPVVTSQVTTVRFTSTQNQQVDFRVVDMAGKIVLQQQNEVFEGLNSITLNGVQKLLPGVYVLQMNNGETMSTFKFTVAR